MPTAGCSATAGRSRRSARTRTPAWLDEAAPGRPVALWAHDHHSRWLSARAIQVAGLAARDDPPSGRIERDDEGRPTGVMYEAAAGLVDAFIPAPTADDVDWAIGRLRAHARRAGRHLGP